MTTQVNYSLAPMMRYMIHRGMKAGYGCVCQLLFLQSVLYCMVC
jgi:hypothetical protein